MNMEMYEKYEYISFDIFDTLIKRNVEKPSDIFFIVEKIFNNKHKEKISDFKNIRIDAEKKCREEKKTEVKLDEIYYNISQRYSNEIAEELKQIEIQVEISFCQKNNNELVKEIYEWALINKKIIIISDMYLPINVIKQILEKNNIKYEKIYLSSEIGEKKSTSKLFEFVLKDLNIDTSKIIHIGDNKHSDIKMSKKLNINSILVEDSKIETNKFISDRVKTNINFNILFNFIKNNLNSTLLNDYFYQFGYKCFGPLLFSYSSWLKEKLLTENIDKVYFLARDGKIMKNAFDILNGEANINTHYMMASRRSIIVPSLWKCNNIEEMFNKINIPRMISIDDLSKRLGLDDIDFNELLLEYSIDRTKKIEFETLKVEYKEFLNSLYPLIVNNSEKEFIALKKYLSSLKFEGKVAIVDIGWYGNMQAALKNIIEESTDVYGYYIGLRPNKKGKIKTLGYLFDENKNLEINDMEFATNAIFEFIFSATHGSVKKFVDSSRGFELYESENEKDYEKQSLITLQKGAIDFVRDFYNSEISKYYEENVEDSVYLLFNTLTYPNLMDSKKIGDLQFKDSETVYIAKSEKITKYLSNPKKFLKDLKSSTWKIGFMKNVFKLNLPYAKIYKLIKKIM